MEAEQDKSMNLSAFLTNFEAVSGAKTTFFSSVMDKDSLKRSLLEVKLEKKRGSSEVFFFPACPPVESSYHQSHPSGFYLH